MYRYMMYMYTIVVEFYRTVPVGAPTKNSLLVHHTTWYEAYMYLSVLAVTAVATRQGGGESASGGDGGKGASDALLIGGSGSPAECRAGESPPLHVQLHAPVPYRT